MLTNRAQKLKTILDEELEQHFYIKEICEAEGISNSGFRKIARRENLKHRIINGKKAYPLSEILRWKRGHEVAA